MYFEFSILLVTYFIFAESAFLAGEEEILGEIYKVGKLQLNIPPERGYNEAEMAKLTGIDVLKLREIANSHSITNLDNINLRTFKLLGAEIFEEVGFSLKKAFFSEKAQITNKSPEESQQAGPSTRPSEKNLGKLANPLDRLKNLKLDD